MRSSTGILAAAAAAAMALPSAAAGQVTLSAAGGATFASITVVKTSEVGLEASRLRRYSGGLKLAVPVADRFLFRLDGGYAQRGARLNFELPELPGSKVDLDIKTGHLELASLVGVRFGGPAASAYVLVGPSAAYEFQCRRHVRAAYQDIRVDEEVDCDRDQDEPYRAFDFGAAGVAGFEIGLGSLALSLEGVYYMGLYDIANAADDTFRHQGVSVRAGIGIPIG